MTVWISVLRSDLRRLITLYSCNRNITLKMAGLQAETGRCKYHNENKHQWNYVHSVRSSHTLMHVTRNVLLQCVSTSTRTRHTSLS